MPTAYNTLQESEMRPADGARPIRRRKWADMELVGEVVPLFVLIRHSFLTLGAYS
jgi:hypothetical protein